MIPTWVEMITVQAFQGVIMLSLDMVFISNPRLNRILGSTSLTIS